MNLARLPIDDVLPSFLAALRHSSSVVLRAPTGAGKTTRVPPAIVDAWMAGVTRLPPDRLLQAFERAFGALWRRALRTLGDVTLTAILDRVLTSATEKFPALVPLKVDAASGLRFDELRASPPRGPLAEALRFVLVEFLTVLGYLTAEVLTPFLHAELSKVAHSDPRRDEGEGK